MNNKLISLNQKDNIQLNNNNNNQNNQNKDNKNKKKSPSKVIHLPKIDSTEVISNSNSNSPSNSPTILTINTSLISNNNTPSINTSPTNNNNGNIGGQKNNKQNITNENRVILKPIVLSHENNHNNNHNTIQNNHNTPTKLEPIVNSLSHKNEPEHQILQKSHSEIIINEFTQLNGNTTIIYEMYKENFQIKNGTISTELINDTYGFSDIMPECKLYLSKYSPTEIREMKIQLYETNQISSSIGLLEWYLSSDSERTIHYGLKTNESYYCYIQEKYTEKSNNNQINYQEKHKTQQQNEENNDGRGFDTCTCIYGTPCLDEYGCKNWKQRFNISKQNGWDGDVP